MRCNLPFMQVECSPGFKSRGVAPGPSVYKYPLFSPYPSAFFPSDRPRSLIYIICLLPNEHTAFVRSCPCCNQHIICTVPMAVSYLYGGGNNTRTSLSFHQAQVSQTAFRMQDGYVNLRVYIRAMSGRGAADAYLDARIQSRQ